MIRRLGFHVTHADIFDVLRLVASLFVDELRVCRRDCIACLLDLFGRNRRVGCLSVLTHEHHELVQRFLDRRHEPFDDAACLVAVLLFDLGKRVRPELLG